MFGLTRREQRWKAEQQAAEALLGLVATTVKSVARVEEAKAFAKANADALEVERLRLRVAELERKLEVSNAEGNSAACTSSTTEKGKDMNQEKLDHIVAGAIYDFMGWLTTRPEKLMLSSTGDAAPAAEAVEEFLTMRGVVQDCEPMIHDWPARCSMVTASAD